MKNFLNFFKFERETANAPSLSTSDKSVHLDFIRYSCGAFDIKIPHDHKLPDYQSSHPLYDRFLPMLAKALPPQSIVIDVGANVGDTYASMISENKTLQFHCFEPDPEFYSLLVENMSLIVEATQKCKTPDIACREFVGSEKSTQGILVSRDGSAHIESAPSSNATINYLRLDDYIKSNIPTYNIDTILIKSDVDGFDYDAINSLGDLPEEGGPLLFFECQTDTQQQLEQYKQLINRLGDSKYTFISFDNFGNPINLHCTKENVFDLLDYVWRQNINSATRTIWYIDVLAYQVDMLAVVDRAFFYFNQEMISRISIGDRE
ncbi:MAG: FkbM family methyltransferase [Burkholderiales bacterium]|nr:FkbM family methyltransferase [Burkholderiales bacterium]